MPFTQVQSAASNNGGSSSSVTVTWTAPTAGNLLVAAVTAATSTSVSFIPPSGWSAAGLIGGSGTNCSVGVYYKIADGTESTVTFGKSSIVLMTAEALEYSGTGARFVSAVTNTGNSVTSLNNGNPADPNIDALFGFSAWALSTNPGTTTYSNSFTQTSLSPQLAVATRYAATHAALSSTASWTNVANANAVTALFTANPGGTVYAFGITVPSSTASGATNLSATPVALNITVPSATIGSASGPAATPVALNLTAPTITPPATIYATPVRLTLTPAALGVVSQGNQLIFTPPIEQTVPPVYINNRDPLFPVPLDSHYLFSHFGARDRGVNVFVLDDGTVTQDQPWPITRAVQTYYGGHIYTVTDDQAVVLRRAGYYVSTQSSLEVGASLPVAAPPIVLAIGIPAATVGAVSATTINATPAALAITVPSSAQLTWDQAAAKYGTWDALSGMTWDNVR